MIIAFDYYHPRFIVGQCVLELASGIYYKITEVYQDLNYMDCEEVAEPKDFAVISELDEPALYLSLHWRDASEVVFLKLESGENVVAPV